MAAIPDSGDVMPLMDGADGTGLIKIAEEGWEVVEDAVAVTVKLYKVLLESPVFMTIDVLPVDIPDMVGPTIVEPPAVGIADT